VGNEFDIFNKKIYEYGIIFDEINSVSYVGEKQVYDLSVSGNHIFLAQGFLVKNSQIEPRTLAGLSGDENLQRVYKEGKDIYKYLASVVFEIDYNEVQKHQRNAMKSLVLALLYGMSTKSFAQKTNMSVEEAEQIFKDFFERFSGVNDFIHNYLYKVGFQRKGIETPFGRFIPINTYNKEKAKRLFRNYKIQSTASEMALFQFSDITHYLIDNGFVSKVVGSVHDSIVIDTKTNELFKVLQLLKYYGEQVVKIKYEFLKVPLVLDIAFGESWSGSLELKSWEGNKMLLEGKKEYVKFLQKKLDKQVEFEYIEDNRWLMLIKN
jgi:DNA polymerase I-like protein with 3'-5' exonuclease and polymerase domains